MTRKSQKEDKTEEDNFIITRLMVGDLQEDRLKELDEYRKRFEKLYGPSDLRLRYTSALPAETQNYLLEHAPERYWAGLPEFHKAWFRGRAQQCAEDGRLDDIPAGLIKLFSRGKMILGAESKARE